MELSLAAKDMLKTLRTRLDGDDEWQELILKRAERLAQFRNGSLIGHLDVAGAVLVAGEEFMPDREKEREHG